MAPANFDLRGCARLAGCLALALLIPVVVGNGELSLAPVLATTLIAVLAILFGRPLGLILRLPRHPGFIAAFEVVAGYAAASLVQFAFTVIFRLNSLPAAGLTAIAGTVFFLRRGRLAPPPPGADPRSDRGKIWDGGILLAISVLTAVWSREALTALRAARTGIFPAWWDFFMHGVLVNFLNHYAWFAGRSLYMSGTPSVVYHEGSYVLAALYAGLTQQSALQATLVFWLPAGLVLLGMGVYGLAATLSGRAAGVAATAALFLVPDAARYGLRNPLFSFQWLMEICPGSGYGVALILVALALFALSLPRRHSGHIFLSAVIAGLSGVFRVQTALPALLLFAFLFFATWRPARRWHYWATAGGLLVLIGGSVLAFEHMMWAPHFLSAEHQTRQFLAWAQGQGVDKFAQAYADWTAQWTPETQAVVGFGLLLPVAFGAILPAAILLALWPFRLRRPWQIELIPFLAVGAYLLIIVLLPPSAKGDYSEFAHRPFVLVYAILITTVVADLTGALEQAARSRPWLRGAVLVLLLPLAVLGVNAAWINGARLQQEVPNMVRLSHVPIASHLPEAAAYIRAQARPGDVVLSSDGDPFGVVVCLTERQAFESKIGAYRQLRSDLTDVANARWDLLGELPVMSRYDQLQEFGRRHHIRWFLLQAGTLPGWSPQILEHCRFRSGENRVFDLEDAKSS